MDLTVVGVYPAAIGTAICASVMIPGWASKAIPVTIGVLWNSPEGQSRLGDHYDTSAQHLRDLSKALASTEKSGKPKEWDAGDRDNFDKTMKDVIERVDKAMEIMQHASHTMHRSSTVSVACASLCLAAAVTMVVASRMAAAAIATGPLGAAAGQAAAQVVAKRVLASLGEVLKKQRVLGIVAGGILVLGAGWHELQRHFLKNQVQHPSGGKPDFQQVKLAWADEKK
ncbi:hypothetical protein ABZ297_08980 [Nonomuraea sp. NPDC005983]|uniref:hypothetical protein n=1 Tax=Nonomuraea sp. NPDC005983 TaxID=3155595 RepID=UPI0033B5DED7